MKIFLNTKKMASLFLFLVIFLVIFNINFSFDGGGLVSVSVVNRVEAAAPDFNCDFFNPMGCIGSVSRIFYKISALVLSLSSKIFDVFLSFSIDGSTYKLPFIDTGWESVKNLANTLFILILTTISISIILDLKGFGSKETIMRVIIIALFINFSLFASRIIIDAGNITALGFYDAISRDKNSNQSSFDIKEKNISGIVVSAFNPLSVFNTKAWEKEINKGGDILSLGIFVYLFFALLCLYASVTFFRAGFLFVGRVAWLWILMIVSPLAFISYVVPKGETYWKNWWNKLVSNSFCITIFMFIIYLTVLVINSDLFDGTFFTGGGGLKEGVLRLVFITFIQFMIIIKLLSISLSKTKEFCSDDGIGDKIFGSLKALVGLAGFATGGALFAGAGKAVFGRVARKSIGGWANHSAEKIKKKGGGTSALGKMRLKTLRSIGDFNFGTKEGYASRQKRMVEEHHSYASSLSDEKNIDTGKKDEKGNTIKTSARDMYYDRIGKKNKQGKFTSPLQSVAGYSAMTAAAPFTGGLSLLVGAPLFSYMRDVSSSGGVAAKQRDSLKQVETALAKQRKREAGYLVQMNKLKKEMENETKENLIASSTDSPKKREKTDLEKERDRKAYEEAYGEYQAEKEETKKRQTKYNEEKTKLKGPKPKSKSKK